MSLSLSIHSTDLEALEADVLVLGVLKGSEGPYLAPNSLSEDSAEGINELLEALGASGAPDQLLRLPGLEDSGAGILAPPWMRLRPSRTAPCWVTSSRRVCAARPRIRSRKRLSPS